MKSDQSSASSSQSARSIVGLGGLMLVACLAGPAIVGAVAAVLS